jgi:hypothetical protein
MAGQQPVTPERWASLVLASASRRACVTLDRSSTYHDPGFVAWRLWLRTRVSEGHDRWRWNHELLSLLTDA